MPPKKTSFNYGNEYQVQQADKYRNRENNHWRQRIEIIKRMVNMYGLPRLAGTVHQDIVIADIGCSIGTFAIEFAKEGFRSFGIDFDESAIEIASNLAKEEGVIPTFFIGDISDWSKTNDLIDVAICADIFEHLHDDELGSFLVSIRKNLNSNGCLVFHTFPTQYEFLFHYNPIFNLPLRPLRFMKSENFAIATRLYSVLIDAVLLLIKKNTIKDLLKRNGHCNPLTSDRLGDILQRAGYEILFMETSNLYDFKRNSTTMFNRQPISHRNLYGVAIPSCSRK